jgi:hypothetical protein
LEDDELEELIDATSETAVLLKMEDISDDGEEEIDISQFGPPRPYVNQQVLICFLLTINIFSNIFHVAIVLSITFNLSSNDMPFLLSVAHPH